MLEIIVKEVSSTDLKEHQFLTILPKKPPTYCDSLQPHNWSLFWEFSAFEFQIFILITFVIIWKCRLWSTSLSPTQWPRTSRRPPRWGLSFFDSGVCASKYIEFGYGTWILVQFWSGSRVKISTLIEKLRNTYREPVFFTK